ncbi:M15 family metallopeptidase [Cellulomonas sp. C5510]|uniref:M15 family metallopeptidase n=1 Tax=Cellulomonas sp. C5510 TaxID=2871170 RepID=UPI001C96ABC6|nr:M15 family metallopeptidase [Cellulomonas sp. C5510]QZN84301.1 M15 family metallopeptidase [Cellulomonas sp. C5510]
MLLPPAWQVGDVGTRSPTTMEAAARARPDGTRDAPATPPETIPGAPVPSSPDTATSAAAAPPPARPSPAGPSPAAPAPTPAGSGASTGRRSAGTTSAGRVAGRRARHVPGPGRGPGAVVAVAGLALALLAGAALGVRVLGRPPVLGSGPTTANGWPAISEAHDRRLTPFAWVTGRVRAGDVDVVLIHVAERFNGEVVPIDRATSWGWADREVPRGGDPLSNHASGTAVDFNATAHPVGESGTFTPAQVATVRDILADLAPVVAWGGDFDRPDEMHFEIVGTPQEVAEVAERLMVPAG